MAKDLEYSNSKMFSGVFWQTKLTMRLEKKYILKLSFKAEFRLAIDMAPNFCSLVQFSLIKV